jgi:hypothetical protein
MAENPAVFRFEYEILPDLNQWNVFIVAFNQMEAQNHLIRTVKKPLRINTATMMCRVDDLSEEIRKNVVTSFLNKSGRKLAPLEEERRGPGRPRKDENRTPEFPTASF